MLFRSDDPANVMNGSTVQSAGYIYLCVKDGKDSPSVICAFTKGTAQEMATNKTIGTVTSTKLTKAADFNAVNAGSTVPVQWTVDTGVAGSIFDAKTCTLNDGAGACWG